MSMEATHRKGEYAITVPQSNLMPSKASSELDNDFHGSFEYANQEGLDIVRPPPF